MNSIGRHNGNNHYQVNVDQNQTVIEFVQTGTLELIPFVVYRLEQRARLTQQI